MSLTQVAPDALRVALGVCIESRRVPFVWGSPGIGKSDVVASVASDLGMRLIDVRASQWDAVDTRGVPFVADDHVGVPGSGAPAKTTRWAVPDVFPRDSTPTMLFLDELNSGVPSVQAALYQLIHGRRLGEYAMPDSTVIVAAGNLETDRAVTHRMPTALAGRFVHFELVVDPRAWERWAIQNDVHVAIIAFMRYRPELLHQWKPTADSKAQPTPRTWEFASDQLKVCEKRNVSEDVEAAILAGTVGEGAGAEVSGFIRVYRNLPDPDAIILHPDDAPISDKPEVNYAISGALASRCTVDNADRVLRYAHRLGESDRAGPEYMTLLVRTATLRKPEVQSTRAFIKWASDHPEVLL